MRFRGGRYGVPPSSEIITPERIPTNWFGLSRLPNGMNRKVICGIELDEEGRRTAYYILRRNRLGGNASGIGTFTDYVAAFSAEQAERVPADEVYHCFERTHAEQLRGIPPLTAGLIMLTKINFYELSALEAASLGSLLQGFLSEDPNWDPGMHGNPKLPSPENSALIAKGGAYPDDDEDKESARRGNKQKDDSKSNPFHGPSRVGGYLPLRGHIPHNIPKDYPSDAYPAFMRSAQVAVAAALSMDFPTLTGDYFGHNYSSLRQALLAGRKMAMKYAWELCRLRKVELTRWLTHMRGQISISASAAESALEYARFISPKSEDVDRKRAAEGDRINFEDNILSTEERQRNMETNPYEYALQEGQTDAMMKKMGIEPKPRPSAERDKDERAGDNPDKDNPDDD